MPLPIDMLMAAVDEDTANEKLLDIIETIGIPARSWRKGGALRTLIRACSRTYADATKLSAEFVRSAFLDSSSGGWLKILATNVFGITPREASFAVGKVLFTNGGGGIHAYGVEQLRMRGLNGKTYTNTEALALAALGTALIAVRAVEVGSASSAGPGTITELLTPLLGVTISNPASVVGTDDESNEELRAHCRSARAARSLNGPRGAYDLAVREAKRLDGSSVDINRISQPQAGSDGTVRLYLASPSGEPLTSDLDIVRTSIENIARPDGVKALVSAAAAKPINLDMTVWARKTAGLDESGLRSLVLNALTLLVRDYPIGGIAKSPFSTQGYLYEGALGGAAKSAHPAVFDTDGAVDVPLAPGEVAVLTANVTVRFV